MEHLLSYISFILRSQLFGTNICSLRFQRIFLCYSVLHLQKTAIHSRYESHFGREAAQLCMIGCIAVLSHSHRHAFDLSPESKVLSKHCEDSLGKWLSVGTLRHGNQLFSERIYCGPFLKRQIRMRRKIKRINDVKMNWHIKTCQPWCIITI